MWLAVRFPPCVALVALFLAVSPAAPADAAEPLFRVVQVDRYGGDADGDAKLDRDGTQLPRRLNVHPLQVTAREDVCRRARWRVDGRPRRVLLGGDCRGVVNVRGERLHTVTLEAGWRRETRGVTVNDRLVVVLGDSVAAGEGNVAVAPEPAWADRRCHRSNAAAGQVAVRAAAEAARERGREFGLTFISLACSGATIREGLIGPYDGQEPVRDDRVLEPQVERLARMDHANEVDAVIISIGANDVHFGQLVRACATANSCQNGSANLGAGPKSSIADQVNAALLALPAGYADLSERLRQIVDSRRVLISGYFDPTRTDTGQLCRSADIGLDAGEWAFAANSVLRPLNDAVAAAAHIHRWQLVGQTASDYRQHGYCARDRWVVRATESLFATRDSPIAKLLSGTLHPNVTGQLAIASRIASPLAQTLWPGERKLVVATPPIATHVRVLDQESSTWWHPRWWWLLVAAGLWLLWPARGQLAQRIGSVAGPVVRTVIVRPLWLPRRIRKDPMAEAGKEKPPPGGRSWDALVRVGIALVAFAVIFSGFAIERFRLLVAKLPSSGAEYIDGWQLEASARGLWLIAGVVCVAAALGVSTEGWPTRGTRRLLAALVVAGMAWTIVWLQDFSGAQALELLLGLLVIVLCGHHLVDRALEAVGRPRGGRVGREWRWVFKMLTKPGRRGWWRTLWRYVPFLLCGFAVYQAIDADRGLDRSALIALPILLASILIVAPGALAGRARSHRSGVLRPARDLLALTSLVAIVALEIRTEPWLIATAACAALLALGCVYVAHRSGRRFAPFGVALLASVLAFGALESAFDEIRAPKAQAFAALSANGDLVCGVYLGTRDGKRAIAEVTIDNAGKVNGRGRSPRLVNEREGGSAPTDRMPIPRALRQAARELALDTPDAELRELTPDAAARILRHRSCPWPPRRPPAIDAHATPRPVSVVPEEGGRWLAERFQPRFIQDKGDGFWPVQVATTFALESRRGSVCLARKGEECERLTRASGLPWPGLRSDTIDHNVRMDRNDEATLAARALGTKDPHASAAVYFLATPSRPSIPTTAIQYWTYFLYDYVPLVDGLPVIGTIEGGSHQGDWENVGVVLSKDNEPRYFWMSRHTPSVEGRPFAWGEELIGDDPKGPEVWTAPGSHAGYEQCGIAVRDQGPAGLLDEGVDCDPARHIAFEPKSTPLIDLARTPWACFAGGFGRNRGGLLEEKTRSLHLIENAPRGPLWQQTFDHVPARPCEGTDYTGARDGFTEEVLDPAMARKLRAGAGRLERWFDDCDDWEKPPTRGGYLVVCEPRELRKFFASGLVDLPADGPRIGDGSVPKHATTLPAVQRSVRPGALRTWRIGGNVEHATIYAARRHGEKQTIAARFRDVTLKPGQVLRVDERNPIWWRLVDVAADGSPPIADAPVDKVSG